MKRNSDEDFKQLSRVMWFVVGLFLVVLATIGYSLDSKADDGLQKKYVYQYTPHVQFVYTDNKCTTMNNPDDAPLLEAWAFSALTNKRIDGCALKEGNKIEFQLYGYADDEKKEPISIHQFFYEKLFKERTLM